MYFDNIKESFLNVAASEEKGLDAIYELSEQCRERLYEVLDEDGILILEKYILCLDLLNKGCDFFHPTTIDKK